MGRVGQPSGRAGKEGKRALGKSFFQLLHSATCREPPVGPALLSLPLPLREEPLGSMGYVQRRVAARGLIEVDSLIGSTTTPWGATGGSLGRRSYLAYALVRAVEMQGLSSWRSPLKGPQTPAGDSRRCVLDGLGAVAVAHGEVDGGIASAVFDSFLVSV